MTPALRKVHEDLLESLKAREDGTAQTRGIVGSVSVVLNLTTMELNRYERAFAWLERNALFIQLGDRLATQIGVTLESIKAEMNKEGKS